MQKICWLALISIFAFSAVCSSQTQLKMEFEQTDESSFIIHTNVRLAKGSFDFSYPEQRPSTQPELVQQIFKIEGVTRVSVEQYFVRVYFAKLFNSGKISIRVKAVIKMVVGQLKL